MNLEKKKNLKLNQLNWNDCFKKSKNYIKIVLFILLRAKDCFKICLNTLFLRIKNMNWEFQIYQTEDWKVQFKETQEWFSLYLNWENTSILIWKEKVNYLIDNWSLEEIMWIIHEKWTKENSSTLFFQFYENIQQQESENINDLEEDEIIEEDEETKRLREEYEREKAAIEELKKWKVVSFEEENDYSGEQEVFVYRIASISDIDEFIKKSKAQWWSWHIFYFPKYDTERLSIVKENWIWSIQQNWEIPNIKEIIERKWRENESNYENLLLYLLDWVDDILKINPWLKILFNYVTWEQINDSEVKELTRRNLVDKMLRDRSQEQKNRIEEKANKSIEEMSYDELRKYNYLIEHWVDSTNIHEFKTNIENDIVEVQWMLEEQERVIKEFEDTEDKAAIFRKINEKIESWEININNVDDAITYWTKRVNDVTLEWLDQETKQKIVDAQIEEELKELSKIKIWEEINWTIWADKYSLQLFKNDIDYYNQAKTLLTWWRIKWENIFDEETFNDIAFDLREMLAYINNEEIFFNISIWNNTEVNRDLYELVKKHWFKHAKVRSKTKTKETDIILEEIFFKTPDGWEFIFDIKEDWITWMKIHWRFILKWELSSHYAEIEDYLKLQERTRNVLKEAKKQRNAQMQNEKQQAKQSNSWRWNSRSNNYESSSSYSSWWWFFSWSRIFNNAPVRIVWKTVWFTYRTTKKVVWWVFKSIFNFFFR